MKNRRSSLFWGVTLLLVGGFFLARNFGLIPDFTGNVWTLIFGLAALVFFVGYLLSGWRNWPLLFPAVGCAIAATAIGFSEAGAAGELIGGGVLYAVSIPFWIAFISDRRQNWWALIPGWSLVAIGSLIIFATRLEGDLFASLVLLAIALPFLVVFLVNRQNWWALIPAYTLSVIAAIVLISTNQGDAYVPTIVMLAIALPFFLVYLIDRKNWWALIPASILAGVGLILLLVTGLSGAIAAGVFSLAIAIPFYVVYFVQKENWWALIPAGVMTSVGLAQLVAALNLVPEAQGRLVGTIVLAGVALTFVILWSLRKLYATGWAKYPAIVLMLAALLVLIFGPRIELIWSIGLISFGAWLIFRGTSPREKQPESSSDQDQKS